jgi:colanic acid/amylovoran biosynthesis glycosyltransferase
MSITIVNSNSARIDNGVFKVDRKFHVGMQAYAKGIREPLVSIHREAVGEEEMDLIEVPVSDLPYRVVTMKVDPARRPFPAEIPRLRDEISRSKLMYGCGFGSAEIARSVGVPYILILEYDLKTQITVYTADVKNIARRAVRTGRCVWQYRAGAVPDMRKAHSLHCNGYPIFDATRRYNPNSLLYLDSRMSRELIMSRDELMARLATRTRRPLRMLFSGRYERFKGTDDAVKVAVECLRRGLDMEMHFYGKGSLRGEMERIAAQAPPGRIHIHDAVPYTELVSTSRSFDLFVCCHIQNDPSCTYLESFGAGLPIVGYGNRMWQRLREASGAGLVAPIGRPEKVADDVQRLCADLDTLGAMAEKALTFAQAHCYESEFAKRIDALNEATSQQGHSTFNKNRWPLNRARASAAISSIIRKRRFITKKSAPQTGPS